MTAPYRYDIGDTVMGWRDLPPTRGYRYRPYRGVPGIVLGRGASRDARTGEWLIWYDVLFCWPEGEIDARGIDEYALVPPDGGAMMPYGWQLPHARGGRRSHGGTL